MQVFIEPDMFASALTCQPLLVHCAGVNGNWRLVVSDMMMVTAATEEIARRNGYPIHHVRMGLQTFKRPAAMRRRRESRLQTGLGTAISWGIWKGIQVFLTSLALMTQVCHRSMHQDLL